MLALLALVLSGCSSSKSGGDDHSVPESSDEGGDGGETSESSSSSPSGPGPGPTSTTHTSASGTSTGSAGNQAPTAALTAAVNTGMIPLNVTFSIAGSDPDGDTLDYVLKFGDGSADASGKDFGGAASQGHSYEAAGVYNATLTVTDGRGGEASATLTITAEAPTGTDYSCTSAPLSTVGVGGSEVVVVGGCNLTTTTQPEVYLSEDMDAACSVSYDETGDGLSDGQPAPGDSFDAGVLFFAGCGPTGLNTVITITLDP
jgi:hypothetical protein